MELPTALSGLSPQSFSQKNFLNFFLKKTRSEKSFSYISGNGTFLYFLKRKLFLYFRKWIFSIFRETETPKKILIFRKTETPKKFFIFQETELSHISGNGNPKKLLIFQEVTFRARKVKKPTLKKLVISQEMENFSYSRITADFVC